MSSLCWLVRLPAISDRIAARQTQHQRTIVGLLADGVRPLPRRAPLQSNQEGPPLTPAHFCHARPYKLFLEVVIVTVFNHPIKILYSTERILECICRTPHPGRHPEIAGVRGCSSPLSLGVQPSGEMKRLLLGPRSVGQGR